jgi:ElaB/YqjD/DUF883 family membrane-anchored ribosome-binding protein
MTDVELRVARLEQELAAIKEKTSFFTVIYEKFDNTLEKLEQMIEDRRSDANNDLKDVYRKIDDTESKLMAELEKIRYDMKRQHEVENRKIDDLNRWRWIVMGGAAVIGWILSKVANHLAG